MIRAGFNVKGMSCVNCAARIEKELMATDGIAMASVNFAMGELLVEYDAGKISANGIEQKVESLGYGITGSEAGHDDGSDELRRERNWLIISMMLALPIMATMSMHDKPVVIWMNLLLAAIIQFSAGMTFYRGSWYALKSGSANMDVLVALGTSAAFFYSIAAFSAGWHGVFFETSAMLIAFIRLGKYLEARARGAAGKALQKLLNLQPEHATLLTENGERQIKSSEIVPGDILLVRPGESFPVDGKVLEGESGVDESLVTGESMPVYRSVGSEVTGSTINLSGVLTITATRVGKETILAKIVRMVQEAQSDKAPIQRFADRVSAWFVPTVLLISLATFATWYLLSGNGFIFAFRMAIAVIVIACPCAMGLATPTAIMIGSSVGLANGILVRRGSVLEHISHVDTVIIDKTGTITVGKPELTGCTAADWCSDEFFLERLAASASRSLHPLAVAISASMSSRGVSFGEVTSYQEERGRGTSSVYGGNTLLMGSRRYLDMEGVDTGPLSEQSKIYDDQSASTVWLAVDGRAAGIAAFADPVKKSSPLAIALLRRMGINCIMLTGDSQSVASAVAAGLELNSFEAEVTPERKQQIVRDLKAKGHSVAMVGDGINDSPALALADVGIAIGSGTDVAKETGDIILVRNDLMDVVRSIRLGRATLAKVRQNLFWALFYNVAGIPIAAGLLYPAYGLVLKPEYAGLAMAFSSVTVVVNSLLLKRFENRFRG